MFNKVCIIPTGDELADQIVIDTDSPFVMEKLLQLNGRAIVMRLAPVRDQEAAVLDTLRYCSEEFHADLIIFIGGSGGGHRFSRTLGKDFTQSALEKNLADMHSSALYGKNGHLWSKLVIGHYGLALVLNLPGPYAEVQVTMDAFIGTYRTQCEELECINAAMAAALKEKYGT